MLATVLGLLLACNGGKDTAPPNKPVTLASACDPAAAPADEAVLVFDGAVPKNLLIISLDTVRRDRVSRYAPSLDTTPFLDSLFAEGVALDDFRACANWTLPGVTCAVSGRTMLSLGAEPVYPDNLNEPDYLPADLETLAVWLSAAGWQTALVTSSKLFSDEKPTGNGFGSVQLVSNPPAKRILDISRETLPVLAAEAGDAPWYLHVHLRDPHSPYAPPDAYQGDLAGQALAPDPRTDDGVLNTVRAWERASADERAELQAVLDQLYQGELRYMDAQLAQFWRDLSAGGWLDDTLVVFWSDHGEQFFEFGSFQHNASLQGVEAMAVAAFWADNLQARAHSGPTMQQDIPPTLLRLYGLDVPAAVSGVPLGEAPADRVRTSTSTDKGRTPIHSVERSGHRMLYSWDGARAYYQVPNDPDEQDDLYDADSEDIACLWDALRPIIAQVDAERVGSEPVDAGP